MPVLCEKLNLLFFCAPKTACTAVAQKLIAEHGGRWLLDDHIWDEAGTTLMVDRKHATIAEILRHHVLSPEELHNLSLAVVTRNPFDWIVSLYEYRRAVYMEYQQKFDTSLQQSVTQPGYRFDAHDHHHGIPNWVMAQIRMPRQAYEQTFAENVKTLYGTAKNKSVIEDYEHASFTLEILQFENLNADLDALLRRRGDALRTPIEMVNVNTKRDRDWRSYYDPASRRIIEHAFLSDFGRFNYRFNAELARG